MKVLMNLIVNADGYDDPERILDTCMAAIEAEGFKVPWFKVKEAE